MEKRTLNRRDFLRLSAAATTGAILAACAPAAPQIIEVEKQVPIEKEVIKEVPVQKIVEKIVEKVVTPTPKPAEKATLRMLWRTMGQNEQKSMEALYDRFEELHPNIKIEPRVFAPYPEVTHKTNTWVASGQPPAIWSCIAAHVIRYWAVRNRLAILDPYIERDDVDLSDYYDPALELCKWRGTWVGLPSLNGPTFMVYNKDLFDEAGLEYPPMDWNDKSWNWDTWMEYAGKLTKFDASGKPTQYAMDSIGDTRYALRHWGLEWFNKEMLETGYPTKFLPDKEGVTETLQHWQDLMYEYMYVPTPGEGQAMRAATPNLFLTGKIAMQLVSASALIWGVEISEFDFGVCTIPFPVNRPRWNYMYLDPWAIITPQEHPDAAWELLKFAASREGQKFYPIEALGWPSPRRSLEDYLANFVMGLPSARHEYTRDEIDVVLEANEFQQLAWGHPAVEYTRYQQEGLQPYWELLLANEIDARECVAQMEEAVNPIIEEITPEWAWEWPSS